jgi:hypothetical protein
LGLEVAGSMIAARVGLAAVMGDGLTALEVGGNAKAAAEIAAVLDEVMAALGRA